jgi:predicted O-linked N-acetylglucosamine transferase (SPINDLY family)
MKQKLESMGITGDRILERDYRPLPDFLRMLGEVDLALDPFPYNGLTVTLQSCWMGVPPVTLLGKTPPSRAAAMILARMGLHDFIAEDHGSYIDRAVAIFEDPSDLVALRPRMRELTQAAWCQGEAYTREFEGNLVKALAARQSG